MDVIYCEMEVRRIVMQPADAALGKKQGHRGTGLELRWTGRRSLLWLGAVSLGAKIAYGLPGLATTSLSTLIAIYAVDFYVSLGVRLSFLSFCTAAARSFDVLIDPFVAWISDQTQSRVGRRRPYMLCGCSFYALLFLALFSPQLSSDEIHTRRGALWFGLSYTIFYLFDAFTNVPYEALGPEITDDAKDRNQLFFVAKLLNLTGMLLASAAPAFVIYLLREAGQKQVDCRTLFSLENLPDVSKHVPPSPPFYRDGDVCRKAVHCSGSAERVCFLEEHAGGENVYLEASIEQLALCPSRPSLYDQKQLTCSNVTSSDPCAVPGEERTCVKFLSTPVSYLQAQRTAFFIVALAFGCFYVLAMTNCVFWIKERSSSRRRRRVPLLSSLYSTYSGGFAPRSLQNAAFKPLVGAWALDGLALSILTTLFPFFVRYVIVSDGSAAHRSGQAMDPLVCVSACMVAFLLGAISSTSLWLQLSRRIGKYKSWVVAHVLGIATNLLFITIQEGDTWIAIGSMFLNGLPIGAQFFTNSILADVIDYDEFLTGTRSEGSFSVFATMIPKFMSIPGGAYPLALIYAFGFRPPIDGVSQSQPAFVRRAIQWIFVFLPILLSAAGFVCKLFFPLKHERTISQIQDGIIRHQKGMAATDPLTGRSVHLSTLTEAEYRIIRPFESFPPRRVRYMVEKRDTLFVQLETLLYSLIGFAASGCLCVSIFLSFPLIPNRKQTFFPVTCVLLFGVTLFLTLLHLSRTYAAWKLRDFDFKTHQQLLRSYLESVLEDLPEKTISPAAQELVL